MQRIFFVGALLISACNAEDAGNASVPKVAPAGVKLGERAVDADSETSDFYALMQDTGSAKMLILDSIEGGPTSTSILVLDVFSSPKSGLLQTLEFNCPRGTYSVTRKSMFTPDGPPVKSDTRGKSEQVPMGSQLAFVANLACSGEADLERDRMVKSTLRDIIARYWSK